MKRMTVSQRVNKMYRMEREKEILKVFETITKKEVLAMLEKFIDLGVITVKTTKTKVQVQLQCSPSSFHFDDILDELYRACTSFTSECNCFGNITSAKFTVIDGTVQIMF